MLIPARHLSIEGRHITDRRATAGVKKPPRRQVQRVGELPLLPLPAGTHALTLWRSPRRWSQRTDVGGGAGEGTAGSTRSHQAVGLWGHNCLLLFPWTLVLPIPAGHPQRPEGEARAQAKTGSGCPRQKRNKCLSPSGGWLGYVAGGGNVKGQPGRQARENGYTG